MITTKMIEFMFRTLFFILLVINSKCHDFNGDKASDDYLVKVASQTGDWETLIEGESIVLHCDIRTISGNNLPVNPGKIQYRWLFNGANLNSEARKYSNNNQLIILKTDYLLDSGSYTCQCFLPQLNHPLESSNYNLNIHWISKKAEIIHFKYPEQDEDIDLPITPLPIDSINQFKSPFKLGLRCQASGYPELQFDWYLNGEVIIAPNVRLSGSKYSLEGNNLYIIGQDPSVNGVYTCSVRNSVGNLNSENSFIIKVKNKRQSLELKSITTDQIVNQGQQFVLNCEFGNYDRIVWYSPSGNVMANSSRSLISANGSVLIIEQADKSTDEGVFRCMGVRVDKRLQYSIRVDFAFIDEFVSQPILALYNQNYKINDGQITIVVPEYSKFELVCLAPKARPAAKIHWLNSENQVILNQGKIRVLENHQLLIQNANLDQSGVYKCVAENKAGKRVKQFMIKVQKLPLLANHDTQIDVTTKEQTNVTFDCLDKSTSELLSKDQIHYSVQWYQNGALISPGDKHKLTNRIGQLIINAIHSLDEGLYVCLLNYTGYPLTYNAGINLKVIELLKFISFPVDRRLELNKSAKIHCRARTSIDSFNLQIKWIKGDTDLLMKSLQLSSQQQDQSHLNLNSNLLIQLKELISLNPLNDSSTNSMNVKDENGYLMIKQMNKSDEGFYTCLAFTSQELIYATIRLDAFLMPKFIRTPPDQLVKTTNDNLILNCEATGDPKPFVKFDKDQNPVLNSSRIQSFENGSLIISNLTEEDSGRYSCLVGNSGGFIRAECYLTVKSSISLRMDQMVTGSIDEMNLNLRIKGTIGMACGIFVLYVLVIAGLLFWFRYKNLADRQLIQNEIIQGTSSSSSNQSTGNSSNSPGSDQGTKSNSLEKYDFNEQLELKGTNNFITTDLSKSFRTSTYLIDDSNGFLDDTNPLKSTDTFDRKNLDQIMLLGNGEFGNVFLAKNTKVITITNSSLESTTMNEDEIVMVKILQSQDPVIQQEFRQEIEMFQKLSHDHITKLLAICLKQEPYLMILEYADFGDLKQYLLATRAECNSIAIKPEPLSKIQLLQIAKQITSAMCHLTTDRFFVHKDLATRNCLISSSLNIKLTLCSLSNDTYSNEYIKFRNRNLPLRWCAYEALFDSEFSKYSDAWSFGVLVYELMFAGELPYSNLRDEEVFNQLKCRQLRLDFDQFDMLSDHLLASLKQCLNYHPLERPSFTSLHNTLVNELNFLNG